MEGRPHHRSRQGVPRRPREKKGTLGKKIGAFTRFFNRPDPDFWNFDSFLNALLEEVFVYDALSLVFRPKWGSTFGMNGRGLLGSDLDSLRPGLRSDNPPSH